MEIWESVRFSFFQPKKTISVFQKRKKGCFFFGKKKGKQVFKTLVFAHTKQNTIGPTKNKKSFIFVHP